MIPMVCLRSGTKQHSTDNFHRTDSSCSALAVQAREALHISTLPEMLEVTKHSAAVSSGLDKGVDMFTDDLKVCP